MQNIQITQNLFSALIKYHLMDCDEEEDLIKMELSKKLDTLVKREIYSKYKKAKMEEEREIARREYLDHIGMQSEFRW